MQYTCENIGDSKKEVLVKLAKKLSDKPFWLIAVIVFILFAVGCSTQSDRQATNDPVDEGTSVDINEGQKIVETGGASGIPCASCHTTDGSELVGPAFLGIAERAGSQQEDVSAEEYLRESILTPDAFLTEGFDNVMPAIYSETLSAEDIDNVIAYLLTLNQ